MTPTRGALTVVAFICTLVAAQPGSGSGPPPGGGSGSGSGSSGATLPTCATDGTDYEYAEAVSGAQRTITSNHCPNHAYYDINPNYAVAASSTYSLPLHPKYSPSQQTDLSEQGGGIGVLFDGGILYSPYGGQTYGQATSFTTSAPYAEGDTFDHCGGHSATTADASFHYHVPPVCLLRQLGAAEGVPSPQVGWAFDGFPVYGPLGPGGTQMKTCTVTGGTFGTDVCTDDCTGYYGDTGDGFMYRYYMLGGYNDGECCTAPYQPDQGGGADYYPFTNNCFNGCCPSGVTCDGFGFSLPACSSSAEDGTSSSFEAVTQDALAVNGDSCAAADVCCDGSYTDKCPPASCDTCVTTFPALPTPEPTTPAPTPPPAVAVTLALGMSGIACDAYGAAEEAAVNAALEASIPGTDASASFSAHTCADVARRLRDRRRGLMTADTTTVEIGTTASIDVAEYADAQDDGSDVVAAVATSGLQAVDSMLVIGAVTSTLTAAVSSGEVTTFIADAATDAGLTTLDSVSVDSVAVTTVAPTPAPTAAPTLKPTPAPTPAPMVEVPGGISTAARARPLVFACGALLCLFAHFI